MRWTLAFFITTFAPIAAAEGPCSDPAYRQWDFWVGEWDVRSVDGQPQGTNSITQEENGCLIVERWTSAAGGTGQSYNFYHLGDEQWHQLWISPGAIIEYSGGLTDDGAMKLDGTITYQTNGVQAQFTGSWTPNEDGTVLQEFKQWDDATNTWKNWFTGVYHRQSP